MAQSHSSGERKHHAHMALLNLLFVGAVQALIFTMLTLVFLSIATAGHGHGEHEGAHAGSHH